MATAGHLLKRRRALYAVLALAAALTALVAWAVVFGGQPAAGPGAQSEQLGLKGRLQIEVYGSDGRLRERREVNNTILDLGKESTLVTLFAATHPSPGGLFPGPFTFLAVGSGDIAAPADPNLLGAELFRLARLVIPLMDTATNCVSQNFLRGPTAADETYREAGLATTGGPLFKPILNRVTFAPATKPAGGSVAFTMTVCMP